MIEAYWVGPDCYAAGDRRPESGASAELNAGCGDHDFDMKTVEVYVRNRYGCVCGNPDIVYALSLYIIVLLKGRIAPNGTSMCG